MDAEAFRRYWRETHGPLAAKLPGIRKHVQNHSIVDPDGKPPTYDGYAEAWFDNAEALDQAMASPEGQAVIADQANFIDLERMPMFLSVDEVTIV